MPRIPQLRAVELTPRARRTFDSRPACAGQHIAIDQAQLALQLPFPKVSESMCNHDSKIVGAGSVD
jgi:hypothetical protein